MTARAKISISTVSVISMVSLTSVVFCFFGFVYYNYQERLMLNQLSSGLNTTTSQLSKGLSIAIWNFDENEVKGILESGLLNQNVSGIEVEYNDAGGTILSVTRGEKHGFNISRRKIKPVAGDLSFESGIYYSGEKVGKLSIYATTEFVYAQLKKEFRLFIFYLLLSIALIIAIVYFIFYYIIIRPLKFLEHYALSINFETYNHSRLVEKKFYKELEYLSQSLQKMVASLNSNYKKLEESERKFKQMASLLPQTVFELNTEGRFLFVNESGLAMFGLTKADLEKGINISDIMTAESYEQASKNMVQILAGGANRNGNEYKALRRDGTIFPLMAYSSVVMEGNKPVGIRGVGIDLTEQRKSEAALRELDKLRAQALIEGQEQERHRISREIHDGVGQMMTAIKLGSDSINMASINTEADRDRFEYTKSLVYEVIAELRQVSNDLSPTFLYDYGLFLSINQLTLNVSKISDIHTEFNSNIQKARFLSLVEITFYRIAQEAVNNAIKYSEAKNLKIQLLRDGGLLKLTIEDDGTGTDLSQETDVSPGHGNGLKNMASRASIVGADFSIVTSPGKGFCISLHIPVENITV